MSEKSQVFKGSLTVDSAGSANVVVAGSAQPSNWTVTTTYSATNINPDLRVTLKIGDQSFLIAPGVTTTTHEGKGTEVSYIGEFLAGVNLRLDWSASY